MNMKKINETKKFDIADYPTAQQLENELKRIRYRRDYRKVFVSTISSLTVVAAIAVLISTLILPVLRVTGTSMTPTLQNNEFVICSKASDFKSGDIVAFYYNNKILLKRVIGTSGDVIDISDDGTVHKNGKLLNEPYLNEKSLGTCDIELPYQVPDNRIFVMGDHRQTSIDSRTLSVGCIADEYIIGKVIFRLWPINQIGTL
ncbi:MAG: signal peptidase I [Ruminococcus sp.]|nr:signal peptidase I [Ruminococcus sp.]